MSATMDAAQGVRRPVFSENPNQEPTHEGPFGAALLRGLGLRYTGRMDVTRAGRGAWWCFQCEVYGTDLMVPEGTGAQELARYAEARRAEFAKRA